MLFRSVYSVPYTDQNIFTLEGAVAVRDSVMGANIEGSDSTQHMETNRNVVLPEYKALNVGGHYVGELRGMWRMRNGLMAGPFICHIRLDEVNKRVVLAEGFCYAPTMASVSSSATSRPPSTPSSSPPTSSSPRSKSRSNSPSFPFSLARHHRAPFVPLAAIYGCPNFHLPLPLACTSSK